MRPRLALTLSIVLVAPEAVLAQGGAISLSIDPSIRSAGMGNATTSVFWGADPNYWANPALLGYHSGLRYEWGSTKLVPSLADDVFFKSSRLTLGAWGAALAVSLHPYRLSYGVSEAVDIDGNVFAAFESYEDIGTWGGAISVVEFGENVLNQLGVGLPPLSRYGDVSVGYMHKNVDVFLVPEEVIPDPFGSGSGQAKADTDDFGLLLRATPWNSIDHPFAPWEDAPGLRVDLNFARSWLNYSDAVLDYGTQQDPILQDTRRGFSVRVAVSLPESMRRDFESRGDGWLMELFTPLVSYGRAWDRSENDFERVVHHDGWELTVFNVFTLRGGEIDDPEGGIQGSSTGWGVGVQFGDIGGVRWDHATIPQASELPEVSRNGFMVFVDALELSSRLRAR